MTVMGDVHCTKRTRGSMKVSIGSRGGEAEV